MRTLMLVAVALTAVVGAGVAYSASSPSAKLAKQDRVWGGGHVAAGSCSVNVPTFCPPDARNFAVDAHAEGDGSGAAGNSAYNAHASRTVTCLSVNGNKAAIGGVVLVGGNIGNPGDVYVQYFVDRGTTSLSTPQHDYMSAIYTVTPPLNAEWPEGFPYVCPPAEGTSTLPPVYLEIDGGDVSVQDAPSD
jgi:hypothetical protein